MKYSWIVPIAIDGLFSFCVLSTMKDVLCRFQFIMNAWLVAFMPIFELEASEGSERTDLAQSRTLRLFKKTPDNIDRHVFSTHQALTSATRARAHTVPVQACGHRISVLFNGSLLS